MNMLKKIWYSLVVFFKKDDILSALNRMGLVSPRPINVFVGIDASAPISDTDLDISCKKIRTALQQCNVSTVIMGSFDTVVHIIGKAETSHVDSKLFERGYGGTDISVIFDVAQELHSSDSYQFDAMIICTDGHVSVADIEKTYNGDIPLMFVVTPNGANYFSVPSAMEIVKL